jgi:hypothetical protein
VATPEEMRLFALECLRWAEQADDQKPIRSYAAMRKIVDEYCIRYRATP